MYYGDARILPGGRVDDDRGADQTKRVSVVRKDVDLEPVTYHASHTHVCEDVLHQVGSKGRLKLIFELTATEPTMALIALEWQCPYLGVGMNLQHIEDQKTALVRMLFQRMQTVTSRFYEPELVKLLGDQQTTGSQARHGI